MLPGRVVSKELQDPVTSWVVCGHNEMPSAWSHVVDGREVVEVVVWAKIGSNSSCLSEEEWKDWLVIMTMLMINNGWQLMNFEIPGIV